VGMLVVHGMQVLVSLRGCRAGVKIPASIRCLSAGLAVGS
jgi:hypothetical protein